jgi:hypothetical protein
LLLEAPVLQGCSAARLVLPVLLSAERPFIVHPAPEPRSAATAEEVAAIDLLFKAAESLQINGQVPVSELDKLLEESEDLEAFAPAWRQILAVEGSPSGKAGAEEQRMLSRRAFLVKREQAIARATSVETQGEVAAETETALSAIPAQA